MKMFRIHFKKRLSEAYGYVYDDMNTGGERVLVRVAQQ